jgi:transcriptional regulator of acetoin/glycerol metabolism
VVESREVVPLGSTRGRRIDLRICSATHRDLRALVEDGQFRRDLYHRLGQPAVALPPLRAWPEEAGWIIDSLVKPPLTLDVALVEEAILRPWPGNVRELAVAVASAVRSGDRVLDHLPDGAGREAAKSAPRSAAEGRRRDPGKQAIIEALRASGGNLTQAARQLGTSRTQIRRWMQQHGVRREDH